MVLQFARIITLPSESHDILELQQGSVKEYVDINEEAASNLIVTLQQYIKTGEHQ